MQFVQRVLTDLTRCKSPTDYYRVQLEINRYATPSDVAILSNRPIAWSEEFDAWLNHLAASTASIRKEPAPYRLHELDRATSLYSGETRASKLIVGFSGRAGLLLMPVSVVLQYLAPGEFDLLVVREGYKGDGREGGSGGSFQDMIERLRPAVGMSRYREVRTYGTSAGGAAALAAGVLMSATRAASFSGHLPSSGISYRGGATVAEVEAILRGARPATAFSCVYGADNKFDVKNAMALSRFLPLRHFPIAGVSEHNIVHALHTRKELAKVFADVGLTDEHSAQAS